MIKLRFRCGRKSCFGNVRGRCDILESGYSDENKCPFFKTAGDFKSKIITKQNTVIIRTSSGCSRRVVPKKYRVQNGEMYEVENE